MRIHTFAAPEELQQELCTLSPESSHHLARVLRVRVGQALSVFDGQGHGADAEVDSVSKSSVVLRIGKRWVRSPHRVKITLIQALPKGAKLDLILQKAVELGCAEIIPLQSQNAIVKFKASDAEQKRARWEKIILNAAEQCGTCWLPQITAVIPSRNPVRIKPTAGLSFSVSCTSSEYGVSRSKSFLDANKKTNATASQTAA